MKRYIRAAVTNTQVRLCQECIRAYRPYGVELGKRSGDQISFTFKDNIHTFDMKQNVTALMNYLQRLV